MSLKKALELVGEKHSSQCLPSAALVEAVLSDPAAAPSDAAFASAASSSSSSALVLDEGKKNMGKLAWMSNFSFLSPPPPPLSDVVWPAPSESFLLHISDYWISFRAQQSFNCSLIDQVSVLVRYYWCFLRSNLPLYTYSTIKRLLKWRHLEK